MLSIRELKLLPVWVSPGHLVSTARIVLDGHQLRALGVLEDGELVGMVTHEALAGAADFSEIRACMMPPKLVLDAATSIRKAADMFVRENVDVAPVISEDRYLGIVTANMLLRELGQSWDPLTSLSWSDRLREWGIEHLKRGDEITILFVDLDEFGQYNKRFGHLVGDRILQRVAQMLAEAIDHDRDVLVRYGGDEFAIGTVRDRSDADALSAMLKRRVHEIFIDEAEEGVDFTIGIHGGKRGKERENVHYAATLDNLINLASKDCMAQKRAKEVMETRDLAPVAAVQIGEPATQSDPQPQPAPVTPISVVSVFADDSAANSLTQVIIRVDEAVVTGVSARMGKSVIESIAHATAKALERKFPDRPMQITDIHLTQSAEGQRLVTVSGNLVQGESTRAVGGVKAIEHDLYTDVALATLMAFQQVPVAR